MRHLPVGAALLASLLLVSLSAAARIVPPAAPNTAKPGGEALPATARQASSASAAWFVQPQLEVLSQLNASDRLALEAQRGVWRAPRVSARFFVPRRLQQAMLRLRR
jgi:hypothetical protein